MRHLHTMQFDGGSRGNPGIGGCGAVIFTDSPTLQKELWCGHFYLGPNTTNNQAEYSGLIEGLRAGRVHNLTSMHIQGDSELVLKQMVGKYKVRNKALLKLYEQAKELVSEFPEGVSFEHIRRDRNGRADALSNLAMDKQGSSTSSSGSGSSVN
eukprot:GSChrysophyteH1.ASY1.ANO1.1570.1 assembled CDS